MAEAPKLRAWCVAMVFGDGELSCMTTIAPDATSAVARAAVALMRQIQPESEPNGVLAVELSEGWLREALKAVKGPKAGTVLSFPSMPPETIAGNPYRQMAMQHMDNRPCDKHGTVPHLGGACLSCADEGPA